MSGQPDSTANTAPGWGAWGLSIVNGVVGDYLRGRQNGLAIDMAFYQRGRPLSLTAQAMPGAFAHPTNKLCILVHGFACNEGVWTFRDPPRSGAETSYGLLLERDLGYTPFYLRYNTGLALADNGQHLAALLEELVACYPLPVQEIVLIGHSMGGLVIRSACHYGSLHSSEWVNMVRKVFYLGTPHRGVRLVQAGHATRDVLYAVPHPITHLIADILDQWSQGVKDLYSGAPLFKHEEGNRTSERSVPWLSTARHYMLAGVITADPEHPAARVFGDGLVHSASMRNPPAEGEGDERGPHHISRVFPRMPHLQLAHDPQVYEQIRDWCQEA